MSEAPQTTPPLQSDPADHLRELWRRGQGPDLAGFLAQAGPLPPAGLHAVLLVDQQQRWRAGERVAAEAYLAAHPGVAADPDLAVALIYAEHQLRLARGEKVSLDEYAARFPGHA